MGANGREWARMGANGREWALMKRIDPGCWHPYRDARILWFLFRWCRRSATQPPANGFDASGIGFPRRVSDCVSKRDRGNLVFRLPHPCLSIREIRGFRFSNVNAQADGKAE
jgi:hypothetical protein